MSALRTVWLAVDVLWTGWRGAPAIDRRQSRRLRRLVRHARSASPYYRRLYAGLPADVTSPTRLPPTQKRDLMAHFDEWVTDPDVTLAALRRDFLTQPALVGRRYLGRYHVVTTSGTTGEPAVLVHDADSWAVQNLVGRRHEYRILLTPKVIGAVLREGVRAAALFVTGGHFAGPTMAASAVGTFPFLARSLRMVSVQRPMAEVVAELNDYRPTLLESYPSVVRLLAAEQRAGRLRLQPFLAILAGEDLTEEVRSEIEDAFECTVIERYAASEVLGIAAPCWRGALHVNSDWYLLEPVDEQYRPVPRGTCSHTVLVTNLANLVQPLIRYDLGDRVELDADPCACGLPFPVVRVRGRSADVVSFDGVDGRVVPVAPLALATVIEETPGVVRCQAVRTGARDLTVRLEIDQAADQAAVWSAVDGTLARFFADHRTVPVTVSHATEPPQADPRTGKFRQVYSED